MDEKLDSSEQVRRIFNPVKKQYPKISIYKKRENKKRTVEDSIANQIEKKNRQAAIQGKIPAEESPETAARSPSVAEVEESREIGMNDSKVEVPKKELLILNDMREEEKQPAESPEDLQFSNKESRLSTVNLQDVYDAQDA